MSVKNTHLRRTERVAAGHSVGAPDTLNIRIGTSWRRCAEEYGLRPEQRKAPSIVSCAELRARRERSDPFYSIARVEIASLAQLLNAPVGVMLTDKEGVILGYAGASDFADAAIASGLREGALWSESEQGTNGMGTCLITREAIVIEARDHFLFQNSALTCCGAPIVDGRGGLIGAINMSGYLRLSAAPTLALVRLAVQNIENRALMALNQQRYLLRFHPHREFISTGGEGILAIDINGRIAGANLSALAWLGYSNHEAVCSQAIEQVIGMGLENLEALGAATSTAKPLPFRGNASLCFGIVQSPRCDISPSSDRPARNSTLRYAERMAIRIVLDRCGWNVSLAASQMGLDRRTLHRKLKLHGLQRYRPGENDT